MQRLPSEIHCHPCTTLTLAVSNCTGRILPKVAWRHFQRDSTARGVQIRHSLSRLGPRRVKEDEPLKASKDPACKLSSYNLEITGSWKPRKWQHATKNAALGWRGLWILTETPPMFGETECPPLWVISDRSIRSHQSAIRSWSVNSSSASVVNSCALRAYFRPYTHKHTNLVSVVLGSKFIIRKEWQRNVNFSLFNGKDLREITVIPIVHTKDINYRGKWKKWGKGGLIHTAQRGTEQDAEESVKSEFVIHHVSSFIYPVHEILNDSTKRNTKYKKQYNCPQIIHKY